MLSVAALIELLKQFPQDIPVFLHRPEDGGPNEPIWKEWPGIVKHVDYDIPHIGGFYGDALVLGTDE